MVNRTQYKTVLWSIYLAIIACSTIFGLFPLPENPKEYIGIVYSFIWCIGLFGFILQRRILYKLFWRIWLSLIFIATGMGFTLFIFMMFTDGFPTQGQLIFYGVVLVLTLPMYYAIYVYAYRSPSVWQSV